MQSLPCFAPPPSAVAWLAVLAGCLLAPVLRAQTTVTPYTLPPGRFTGRVELLSLTFQRHDPDEIEKPYHAQAVALTEVTAGVTANLDLEVGLEWFFRETFNLRGASNSRSGVGNLRLRPKYTFWRDASLPAAAAVMPFVKIPTRRDGVGNGRVEGGLIVPWTSGGPGERTFGAMAEWDYVRNDDDTGYDSIWYVTGLLTQPLTKFLSLYGESSLAVSSAKAGNTALTLGAGVRWQVTDRTLVDGSVHRSFVRNANGWNPVLRVSWGF
jgi:hypothetical protein